MPSGSEPLPEPMLTQIYVAIWCHKAKEVIACLGEHVIKTYMCSYMLRKTCNYDLKT